MTDERTTAKAALLQLDSPAYIDHCLPLVEKLGDALNPLSRFICDAAPASLPPDYYRYAAIAHLTTRGLSDLMAGGHLVSHGYLPQAYSVLRAVLDGVDLMTLFAQRPEKAEVWWTTDEAHVEFTPAAVRKALGKPSYDEVHGLFSEAGTHPRSRGALMTGAMVTYPAEHPSEPKNSIVFFPGPTYAGNKATAHVWLWTFALVAEFGMACQHLIDITDARTSQLTWLKTYVDAVDACAEGFKLVESLLGVHGAAGGPLGDWPSFRARCVSMLEELEAEASGTR
jgi:hypothetical protein